MNNREQEEPKKCSCPYCPGHERWQGLSLELELVGKDALAEDKQRTFQEYIDQVEREYTPK